MGFPFKSALEIEPSDPELFLRTSIDQLDSAEGEKFFGLGKGSVIEICGISGTGKTVLCMQLSVNMCQPKELGGEDGQVVYIETDKKLSYQRFLDVYTASTAKLGGEKWSLKKKILFYQARSPAELMGIVVYMQTLLKAQLKNTRLIVIDSFSTIFRSMFEEYDNMLLAQRDFFMALKILVKQFNVMVVLTSQITDKTLSSQSYCDNVHRRLILKRTEEGNACIGLVDKFPSQHVRSFKYEILQDGFRDY